MYCKNCGENISDASVICPKCGVQVGELKTAEQVTPVNNAQQSKPTNTVGLVGFDLSVLATLFWVVSVMSGIITFLRMEIPILLGIVIAFFLGIAAIVCSAIGVKTAKASGKLRELSLSGLIVSITIEAITLISFILMLAIL